MVPLCLPKHFFRGFTGFPVNRQGSLKKVFPSIQDKLLIEIEAF